VLHPNPVFPQQQSQSSTFIAGFRELPASNLEFFRSVMQSAIYNGNRWCNGDVSPMIAGGLNHRLTFFEWMVGFSPERWA
jgi:hypothetical protein